MKGVGQIVSWSVRDEDWHCTNMITLFKAFLSENPQIDRDALKADIVDICKTAVKLEFDFIDLAFELGDLEGLTASETKEFIKYIADRRMMQLGYDPIYNTEKNPLPWFFEMTSAVEMANFFEQRSTEYARSMTTGTWEAAFEDIVFKD